MWCTSVHEVSPNSAAAGKVSRRLQPNFGRRAGAPAGFGSRQPENGGGAAEGSTSNCHSTRYTLAWLQLAAGRDRRSKKSEWSPPPTKEKSFSIASHWTSNNKPHTSLQYLNIVNVQQSYFSSPINFSFYIIRYLLMLFLYYCSSFCTQNFSF